MKRYIFGSIVIALGLGLSISNSANAGTYGCTGAAVNSHQLCFIVTNALTTNNNVMFDPISTSCGSWGQSAYPPPSEIYQNNTVGFLLTCTGNSVTGTIQLSKYPGATNACQIEYNCTWTTDAGGTWQCTTSGTSGACGVGFPGVNTIPVTYHL